jgi:ABC-2 type transport system ATP-binding protein
MRLTVRQNLEIFARLYGVRDLKGRIAETASDFKLADLLDRPYGKLSAGQKTRVSIAKALLNEPELLMLDEPTASLDPDTADWARSKLELLLPRPRRRSCWLPQHGGGGAPGRQGDHAGEGRIIADETPAELIRRFGRDTLEEVFLVIARRGSEDAETAS